MELGDQQVGWQCMKPTRLQLSLSVAAQHTESSDTLCSNIAQTWTLWCGASCPPLVGQSHWQRLVGELPENPSTRNPSLDAGVPDAWPHNACRSPLAFSSSYSAWPVVAPGGWVGEAVEVGHRHVRLDHAHVRWIP
jgi:hypothetical protein